MKAVIQRVLNASVKINDDIIGSCDNGLLILLGISENDDMDDVSVLVNKITKLRIFSDENGKMNLSLTDISGSALIISNFTLYADCRKGNRPDFMNAAKPDKASGLYDLFIEKFSQIIGTDKVSSGEFGADMQISLMNDGPVTIVLESEILLKKQVTL